MPEEGSWGPASEAVTRGVPEVEDLGTDDIFAGGRSDVVAAVASAVVAFFSASTLVRTSFSREVLCLCAYRLGFDVEGASSTLRSPSPGPCFDALLDVEDADDNDHFELRLRRFLLLRPEGRADCASKGARVTTTFLWSAREDLSTSAPDVFGAFDASVLTGTWTFVKGAAEAIFVSMFDAKITSSAAYF